mmetsp:Transcript_5349/g.8749  ORF Transcript_5349/g.8749 Transcript_5349/m.8749 type:complete len:267 (+) Transcript_5349:65-865(+)
MLVAEDEKPENAEADDRLSALPNSGPRSKIDSTNSAGSHNSMQQRPSSASVAFDSVYPRDSIQLPDSRGGGVVKEGQIWKQCPTMPLVWQERYFVMRKDGSIHYFENKEAYLTNKTPKGVIQISDLRSLPDAPNGIYDAVKAYHNRFDISVYSKNSRDYKLQTASPEEAVEWRGLIYSLIPDNTKTGDIRSGVNEHRNPSVTNATISSNVLTMSKPSSSNNNNNNSSGVDDGVGRSGGGGGGDKKPHQEHKQTVDGGERNALYLDW